MSDDGCARFVRRITMPKARSRSAPRSQRFEDMPLPDELLGVLAEQGLDRAFEIQEAILPDALAGRDVLARAETGSGKTLAFTLAMTARFRGRKVHRRRPLGVVLVPTRELAVQVVDTIHPYARDRKSTRLNSSHVAIS